MSLKALVSVSVCIALSMSAPFVPENGKEETEVPVLMTEEIMGNDMLPPTNMAGKEKRWYSYSSVTGKKWPNGVMIYHLDPEKKMTPQQKKNVLNAFNEITKRTRGCITFKERTDETTGYINVKLNDKDCNCQAGYPEGTTHTMNLQKTWCIGNKVTIMHETLHALGFGHEQVRPDRDNYVYDIKGTERPYKWSDVSTQCLPYDYVSVMHYDGFRAKDPSVTCVGAHCSPTLTNLDVKRLRRRYGCTWMPPYCKEGLDMSQWGGMKAGGNERNVTKGLTVQTDKSYYYRFYRTRGITGVTFDLKARNDAHVALSTTTDDRQNTYEIVLGGWGNTKSCIRTGKQAECKASASSKNLLSTTRPTPLWVSWNNGHIQVGRGKLMGKNVIMQYKHDKPYNVNYFGVSTGWGSTGTWVVTSVV